MRISYRTSQYILYQHIVPVIWVYAIRFGFGVNVTSRLSLIVSFQISP